MPREDTVPTGGLYVRGKGPVASHRRGQGDSRQPYGSYRRARREGCEAISSEVL